MSKIIINKPLKLNGNTYSKAKYNEKKYCNLKYNEKTISLYSIEPSSLSYSRSGERKGSGVVFDDQNAISMNNEYCGNNVKSIKFTGKFNTRPFTKEVPRGKNEWTVISSYNVQSYNFILEAQWTTNNKIRIAFTTTFNTRFSWNLNVDIVSILMNNETILKPIDK